MFLIPPKYSPSYSYLVNCQFQSSLYNKLDEETEEIQWLRLPVFLIHNISAAATVVTRTAGIAETFFKGCGMLLLSPVASAPKDYAKKGLEELVIHTSKNVIRLACFPIEYIVDSITLLIEPKAFIIEKVENLRVNLKHAIAKTIGSKEHIKELIPVNGIAYNKFRAYQRRTFERLEKNQLEK